MSTWVEEGKKGCTTGVRSHEGMGPVLLEIFQVMKHRALIHAASQAR